jgi:hypothetical protein
MKAIALGDYRLQAWTPVSSGFFEFKADKDE